MKKITLALLATSFVTAYAQPITFSLTQTLASGTNQRGLVCTDFDGDGKPDVMVGASASSQIYLFANNGSGQLAAAPVSPFANSGGPIYLAPADYNNDGRQDMAVADYYSNQFQVLLKNSTGYSASYTYTNCSLPYSTAAADFNMDGKMDFAGAAAGSNGIFVFLGDGTGSFSLSPTSPITASAMPYHVSAGLINQDLFPDLAFVSGAGNLLHIYYGNGSGGFTAASGSPYATGTEPRTLSFGNFNNDSYPDIVVCNATSNNINVFTGSASGAFAQAAGSPIATGSYAYQAAVADFNLDGNQDIVVSNGSSNSLSVFSGNGNGSFAPPTTVMVQTDPQSICTGDFNGDGKNDLAVSYFVSSSVDIYMNIGCPSGAFTYTANANGVAQFTNTSAGTSTAATFSWSFGDGASGTGASPSHNYSTGTYTVTLTVTDPGNPGCVITATQVVTVTRIETGLHETEANAGIFTIYPNPSQGSITVLSSVPGQAEQQLVLYSVLGKEIATFKLSGLSNMISLGQFAKGIYIYQLQQSNTVLKTGRLLLLAE